MLSDRPAPSRSTPARAKRPGWARLAVACFWLSVAAPLAFAEVATATLQPPFGSPLTLLEPAEPPPDDPQPDAAQPNEGQQNATEPGTTDPEGAARGPAENAPEAQGATGQGGAPEEAPTDAPQTPEAPDAGAPTPTPPTPLDGADGATGAEPTDDGAPDATPEGAEPTEAGATGALDVALRGGGVEARAGNRTLWRLEFPAGSGSTTEPLLTDDRLYLGHGNSLLELDPQSGVVQRRGPLSGPLERVEALDAETVAATVRHASGPTERFLLRDGALQEAVHFGLEPEMFGYLRAEAQVPDPAARLERDPTNPWLYLAVGLEEANQEAARELLRQGVEAGATFYDLAGLAQALEENGHTDLAETALDAALADFAARGYDPRLLTDPALEAVYNFPLTPLRRALDAGDAASAAFWAPYLALAAPNVPGANEAFSRYAAMLGADAPAEEVAQWRALALPRASGSVGGLDRIASALGRVGWYADLAILVAILGLHLTLIAKYWRPQSDDLKRIHAQRGYVTPVARLFALRYYTVSEKLVLVVMFAAVLALAALADWYGNAAAPPTAVRSGTLVSREAQDYLAAAELTGPRGAFIRGYAAHMGGDEGARALYEAAGAFPPALNNLGALTGDPGLFERALELEPGSLEARYNLGEAPEAFPFHARYRPDEPVLAVPTETDFQNALAGPWRAALAEAFTNPLRTLQHPAPFGFNQELWTVFRVLLLLLTLLTIAFLFVPRPRSARNAPRTLLYHVLALLIPGSGLADEAWGLLLILPWALVGLDVITQRAGWPFGLGLSLNAGYAVLGAIYLVNTVAFFVELASYRQRMRERAAPRVVVKEA